MEILRSYQREEIRKQENKKQEGGLEVWMQGQTQKCQPQ